LHEQRHLRAALTRKATREIERYHEIASDIRFFVVDTIARLRALQKLADETAHVARRPLAPDP
jgi:hypothetical protein